MESARCAWRRSSADTSLERATAKFLLAHSLILSGMVLPAQFKKSEILWILVSFMLSPLSSNSSSSSSCSGALLDKRRSITYCKNPSAAESFVPPWKAFSRSCTRHSRPALFSPGQRNVDTVLPKPFDQIHKTCIDPQDIGTECLVLLLKLKMLSTGSGCKILRWNDGSTVFADCLTPGSDHPVFFRNCLM